MKNISIGEIFNIPAIIIFTFLITSCFINHEIVNEISLSMCIYLLFKWIFNHNKCTFSYIECKLRNVKKERGYIYRFLDSIININKKKYFIFIYIFTLFIIFVQLYKI